MNIKNKANMTMKISLKQAMPNFHSKIFVVTSSTDYKVPSTKNKSIIMIVAELNFFIVAYTLTIT